jgi:hypothetical protein
VWDDGYVVARGVDLQTYHARRIAQDGWRVAARADALLDKTELPRLATRASPKRRGLRWWLHWLRWKEL